MRRVFKIIKVSLIFTLMLLILPQFLSILRHINNDIKVTISGKVRYPGVYYLPRGSYVADVVESAGGMTDDADMQSVNLFGKLRDNEKVEIPELSLNHSLFDIFEKPIQKFETSKAL